MLTGFIFGIGIDVAVGQLKHISGTKVAGGGSAKAMKNKKGGAHENQVDPAGRQVHPGSGRPESDVVIIFRYVRFTWHQYKRSDTLPSEIPNHCWQPDELPPQIGLGCGSQNSEKGDAQWRKKK